MNANDILNNLSNLNESELRNLNSAVVGQLKAIRNRDAALKRHTLKVGDNVSWAGRGGKQTGTITRMKQKKAIVDVGAMRCWDVPFSMLTKVA